MLRTKQLYIVFIGVALLLLGLILIQVYWVNHAYALRKASLNERVDKVLKQTAAYIEDHSTHFYLYGHSYIQAGEGVTVLKTTSRQGHGDTVKLFNAFPYPNKPDTCFYTTGVSWYDMLTLVDITMRFEYRATDTLINIPEQNRLYNDMTLGNYRQLLDDRKNISERINIRKLDSVLIASLRSEHIDLPYAYGLKKKKAATFEYVSNKKSIKQLLYSPYHSALLSSQPFTAPYDIYLHLYNTSSYIGKSLVWSLASSAAIILLLGISFLYFSHTVLRQRKLAEMKTDFINNMTHEFMTPVSNIALALETIAKPGTTVSDKDRIFDIISSENMHLKDNINKVLQIAIMEKGGFMLNPSMADIHVILKKVAQSFEIQLSEENGRFKFDLSSVNHIVMADETHLINMFSNIIDNAIKYADKRPIITLASATIDKKLIITIADNGPGMSAEIQKKIFDKFYRGSHRNVHDVKGFGLGLSYVKSIADAHDIAIQVKSTPGKGTSFIFRFI